MPHSVSAAKRVRQNEKNRLANKSVRSRLRTAIKKLRSLVEAGNIDQARSAYAATEKKLDQAAAKGVLHRKTASRYKSRLSMLINRTAAVKK
jgi:small subunit ribosomal protein S20